VARVYVLINTEMGSESEVLKALRKIEGVDYAHRLWGVYDIILSTKADAIDKLKRIKGRIEEIAKISSKLMLLAS
jgi:hypothetical protein